MPPTRQVALLFDSHRLDRHRRALLAGVRRFAEHAAHWRCVLDPHAADRLPGPYHGLIASAPTKAATRIQRAGMPAVHVAWRGYAVRPLTRVAENRMAAGRLAAAHLLERGYRSFAYLGFTADTASRLERHGFRRWLRRLGRPYAACRIPLHYQRSAERWEAITAALGQWLDRFTPPLGIFCASDAFARTLADLALRKGLRIPDDLGLIGAGNDPVVCDLGRPPLTSIEFHHERVGYQAAEQLDRLMNGEPPPHRSVLIPPTLVPRRSTDRDRVDDPLVAQALYWIETHSPEPIHAEHVAQAVGLSQRHLERRMKDSRGRSVVGEIRRARLEHARLLLEVTDDRPDSIARETGFGSRRTMTRAFRDFLGTTPSAYRRCMRMPEPTSGPVRLHFLLDPQHPTPNT